MEISHATAERPCVCARVVCLSVKSAEQIWIINSTRGKSYRLGVRFYQIWAIKLYLWTITGWPWELNCLWSGRYGKLRFNWSHCHCDRLSWLIYPLPSNAYICYFIMCAFYEAKPALIGFANTLTSAFTLYNIKPQRLTFLFSVNLQPKSSGPSYIIGK